MSLVDGTKGGGFVFYLKNASRENLYISWSFFFFLYPVMTRQGYLSEMM